jgi:hypothetical protein
VATLHSLLDSVPTAQVIVAHECRPYVTDFGDWKYGELTRGQYFAQVDRLPHWGRRGSISY